MTHAVRLVQEAEDDLVSIFHYISATDGPKRAASVMEHILEVCRGLEMLPSRGHTPPELARIGVQDFREVHWKPYRVLYEIAEQQVLVHAILDGRRDLQDILAERLLR